MGSWNSLGRTQKPYSAQKLLEVNARKPQCMAQEAELTVLTCVAGGWRDKHGMSTQDQAELAGSCRATGAKHWFRWDCGMDWHPGERHLGPRGYSQIGPGAAVTKTTGPCGRPIKFRPKCQGHLQPGTQAQLRRHRTALTLTASWLALCIWRQGFSV